MNTLRHAVAGFAAGALILACAAASRPADTADEATPLVLGTFDSRSVAVAYANSEVFDTKLGALFEELEAARAAGDDDRVAELEARGPALQRQLHLQGFSTAPVHDILALIEDQLPGIAEGAGVDAIVSQWELVWQRDGIRCVDVTDRLVAAFEPDERGLKSAREIREHDPLPADELRHDH